MSANGVLSRRLSDALGATVTVTRAGAAESRVDTPFRFADGDHLVIRLREKEDGRYEWTDLGHTFMHLSYELDVSALDSGNRARLLEENLLRFGAEDRNGELVLPSADDELGETLLQFAQMLVQVTDLRYLSRDRVASTFLEDFRSLLAERFGDRAHFEYVDPERDPQGKYPIDCLLNNMPRPVAVFAIPNDDRCRDAQITLLQFRAWGRELFSTGIFEDQETVNRRVLARFTDACDKQFSRLVGNESDIAGYLQKLLP